MHPVDIPFYLRQLRPYPLPWGVDRILNHDKNSAGQRSERKNEFLGQLLRPNKGLIDEKQYNDITFSENPKGYAGPFVQRGWWAYTCLWIDSSEQTK